MGCGQHMLIGFLYKVDNSLKSWKQQSQHTRPIVHAGTHNIGAIQLHYAIVLTQKAVTYQYNSKLNTAVLFTTCLILLEIVLLSESSS